MAIGARHPAPGLLHHSDRGREYAATAYRALLDQHGMIASMSRTGNCWDNAVAESFFSTLEFELIAKHDWRTRAEARRAIFEYIETWYNRHRLHSSLNYLSPTAYERSLESARVVYGSVPFARGKPSLTGIDCHDPPCRREPKTEGQI